MSTHVTVPDPPVPVEALVAAVSPRPERVRWTVPAKGRRPELHYTGVIYAGPDVEGDVEVQVDGAGRTFVPLDLLWAG